MKKLTPPVISALIALGVVAWMATGLLGDGEPVAATERGEEAAAQHARVSVRESLARPVVRELRVTARTAPARQATLAAEAIGRVVEVGAARGARVATGDVIARIDERWRRETLAEAEALVSQREIEYQGAIELAEKGFRARSQKAEALAALEAARRQLKAVQLDLEATVVRAPFDGVLHDRMVEVGDFVDVGNPVAVVVETDPFVVIADVAETDVARLETGQVGIAELIDGRRLEGRLRYIAAKADPATRTFRVELELANPEGQVVTGMSADLALPVESLVAHRLPTSLLSLDEDGNPGIKYLGDRNTVAFHRVDVDEISDGELLVGGLDDRVSVIATGQGFVRTGDVVDPVPENTVAASAEPAPDAR